VCVSATLRSLNTLQKIPGFHWIRFVASRTGLDTLGEEIYRFTILDLSSRFK
jgi:hypothetical protein